MTVDSISSVCNLGALDSLSEASINEILESWNSFCLITETIVKGDDAKLKTSYLKFQDDVCSLCKYGLRSLVEEHFLLSLQDMLEKHGAPKFWKNFDAYNNVPDPEVDDKNMQEDEVELLLCKALEEISSEKQYQEKCLLTLVNALQLCEASDTSTEGHAVDTEKIFVSKYRLIVSSVLMTTMPRHFTEILHWYFKGRLEELSTIMAGDYEDDNESQDDNHPRNMDIDGTYDQKKIMENKLVRNIGMVVHNLRNLGFTSMTEDAYASAIFLLLKAKVFDLAGDDYRTSVLESIKEWIQAVPLQFLRALLDYLGDSMSYLSPKSTKSPLASTPSSCYQKSGKPSEGIVRWQLRLEYFAYETLQDLRIAKLFEIIVDYPDSAPAIEDLKQCLEYTGQHTKLVDSFISALRYRLLTAGASTNDILHQYVSTIKALRTIDPAGVFLEAVGEPIREYLRGRKDTIKCIVTMLTDGTGGNNSGPGNGDSLLEELNRDEENQESNSLDDDINTDDKQTWIDIQRWEPDPVEADPLKGSRYKRKVDVLGMIVGIIGSKDQLINEYRVMLAEKLLNKTDYDIDTEIRTLELLKIHFGESSMQKCEIMLNDLIDSKRTNTNVKATINQLSQTGGDSREHEASFDILNASVISSNFWPPIQDEDVKLPEAVDRLLSDYAKRFHEIKTPRKLLWKKNLGTVKLELEFEDKTLQFTVTPVHASIIMQFQDQKSWTSKNLAAAIGVPVDTLQKRINFWINKGIVVESSGADSNDHLYTLVDDMADGGKSVTNNEALGADDEAETSVASVEDQLRKEMTVYEKFIIGMLRNVGNMGLERIHNSLKIFCATPPIYDKSIQQLQSFLSGLVAEEKLELRDGTYHIKK
ncbi:putative cullin, anaphase-promoting complex subunit 2, cullin domain superfamily [Helianthus annuus]|uniref:Anaphase-promoting complex subunit 2 n=1 Tax=Helianthus annuus TaxID=4232 RepID=A0A251SZW5_HELAN|nr:anaphase-promoting complex subunit 2 [Helianthus annuus]KAF5777096.1 putative cullin, anaphase-promoting complex subunit 2, cullin domain superfamily [Helianthus annuus]KAJ0492249.1 putative cullin, anaphase-promoting complex subunit 2, cullin domain superfamily [Helianthus annuus]KAJ0504532.1 putative cullin, anaphase-promoting complex subunit 2, cullin domain superfamily [Helianthus annuus]KAJ0630480.1 putative cullin, anaphase-promoting complex subunit 2, cullin domain superfamily [Helian